MNDELNVREKNSGLLILVIGLLSLTISIGLYSVKQALDLNNTYTVLLIQNLNELNEKIPPTQESLESPRQEQEIDTFPTNEIGI